MTLLMRITVWRSLAANMTLLMRSFDLLQKKMARFSECSEADLSSLLDNKNSKVVFKVQNLFFEPIICFCLWLRQIMNLLATDKSRYFAQPSPIIVYYLEHIHCVITYCTTFFSYSPIFPPSLVKLTSSFWIDLGIERLPFCSQKYLH